MQAVRKVVTDGLWRNGGFRVRRYLAPVNGRRRIDQQVVGLRHRDGVETAGTDRSAAAKAFHEVLRALQRAVGDADVSRLHLEQRADDAAGRAARAQDQDIGALELQPEIDHQVA